MQLEAVPLDAEAFSEFGEVADLDHATRMSINDGLTTRFHDLFTLDVEQGGGRPLVSVFRTRAVRLPHRVAVMERHPLGSQAFMPMHPAPFLVLVARGDAPPGPRDLALFISNGRQGVNLRRNTWHHFNLALAESQDFLVIDRGGEGDNLEQVELAGEAWIPKDVAGGLNVTRG